MYEQNNNGSDSNNQNTNKPGVYARTKAVFRKHGGKVGLAIGTKLAYDYGVKPAVDLGVRKARTLVNRAQSETTAEGARALVSAGRVRNPYRR